MHMTKIQNLKIFQKFKKNFKNVFSKNIPFLSRVFQNRPKVGNFLINFWIGKMNAVEKSIFWQIWISGNPKNDHFLTPFFHFFPKSSNFEAWFFSPDLRGVKKRVLFSPFFDRFLTPLEPFFTNHVQACSKLALMVVHVSPKIYDSIQYWKKGAQNRTSFWVPIFHFLTLFWPLFITLNHEMPWIQVQNLTQFFNYQLIYEKKVYKN